MLNIGIGLNVKAQVGAFNQEKVLVGAFSVIVKIVCSYIHDPPWGVVAVVVLPALGAEPGHPVQAEGGAGGEGEGQGRHQQPVQPLRPELPQTALC